MTNANHAHLVTLFRDALELCEVTEGESVVIASQPESREGYAEAFLSALDGIGSKGVLVQLPGITHPNFPQPGRGIPNVYEFLEPESHLLAMFGESDLVVDITAEGLIHTKARERTLEGGARMLTVKEPPRVLHRMFPRGSLRRRVERAEDMIFEADTMRITSDAGTNISVEWGSDPPTFPQYGYTDTPGRWDHFAGGFIAAYPIDDSPNGRIVLDVGDVLIHHHMYVDAPVEIEITDGTITEVNGKGTAARLLESYLDEWDDDAYETSHFGFGLDETAVWESMAFPGGHELEGMDQRAFQGNFMWSTGPNRYVGRHTPAHLDIALRNCSISLDDLEVIREGNIVREDLLP